MIPFLLCFAGIIEWSQGAGEGEKSDDLEEAVAETGGVGEEIGEYT